MTTILKNRRVILGNLGAGIALSASPHRVFSQTSAASLEIAKIVSGSPAGSSLDTFARRVAEVLQPAYAKSVLVDSKVGAAGQIAVSAVKAAPPDGSTILVTPMPMMGIYPHSYPKLPYDPVKDFIPVSMGAEYDLAFAVGPMVPDNVKSMNDFFKWCKANPAKANFGSPAAGSTPHFAGSMAAKAANTDITHVAFRGMPTALVDMMGGQIAAVSGTPGDFMAHLDSGKVRVLATTGEKRSRFLPNVATFAEQGFTDIVLSNWFGFFVPAKTPDAMVQKLNASFKTALSNPAVIKLLDDKNLEAKWSTSADLALRLKSDLERWGPIVKSLNFTAES
jgi:tripartite-type tricarboxylate transporter receptor subunit TctC